MKGEGKKINASPSKRIYLSIISDYDLERSICELVDNALDSWKRGGEQFKLFIDISIDHNRQIITVKDNSGGIKEGDLSVIISPGESKTSDSDEVIGLFGVGSKRAVVALSGDIKIFTRCQTGPTFLVEYDDFWLENESWDMFYYPFEKDIEPNSTKIELQKLRNPIHLPDIERLTKHLSKVYAYHLKKKKVEVKINNSQLRSKFFDDWSYPPDFAPKKFKGKLMIDGGEIEYEILGGLTKSRKGIEIVVTDSIIEGERLDDYGVYFYCNDRLIEASNKSYNVGFESKIAGLPHNQSALARIIVSLHGPSKLMPWNSSKTAIDYKHKVFQGIRDQVIDTVKHYVGVSKRLSGMEGGWNNNVFPFQTGTIESIPVQPKQSLDRLYLPNLPKNQGKKYPEEVLAKNEIVSSEKPWTVGLYESIIAVDAISKLKIKSKNRVMLILLDSTLEIAFKEYLVNHHMSPIGEGRLAKLTRGDIEKEVGNLAHTISVTDWAKVSYYYRSRCALIHQRASVELDEKQIKEYRSLTESILNTLFGLEFNV